MRGETGGLGELGNLGDQELLDGGLDFLGDTKLTVICMQLSQVPDCGASCWHGRGRDAAVGAPGHAS